MRLTNIFAVAALCLPMLGCVLAPRDDVRVLDEALRWSVEAGEVQLSLTPTGTARASVELRNRGEQPLALRGRALFYGPKGEGVDAGLAWYPFFIDPKGAYVFEALSVRPGAARAVIEIRAGE